MKKIDLGQTISILANVGVIAGIVFLGFELRQNNRLMEAEARTERMERIRENARDLYSVPGMAELFVKLENGEELTQEEQFRAHAFAIKRLRGMESQYRELQEGNLEPNIPGMREAFRGNIYNAPMRDSWDRSRGAFPEDFARWMDENIAN